MIEAIWIHAKKLLKYESMHKLSLEDLGKLMTDIGEACKNDNIEFLKQFDFVVLDDPYVMKREQ